MPDSDSDSDYSLIDFPHTDSGGGGSDRPSSRNGLDVPPLGEDFEFLSICEGKGKVNSQNMRKPDEGKEDIGEKKIGGLSQAERLQLGADTVAISKPYKQAHEVLKEFENEHGSQFAVTQGMLGKKLNDTTGNKAIDSLPSEHSVPDPGQVDVRNLIPYSENITRIEAMFRERPRQHTRDSLKKHLQEASKANTSTNIPRPTDKVKESWTRPPRAAVSNSRVPPAGTDGANTRHALFKPDNLEDIHARPLRGYLSQAFPRIPKRALGQDEEDADANEAGDKAVTGKPEPILERKASHVPITVRRTETPKVPVLPHLIWSEQSQQWVVSNISYVSPEVATELNLHIKNMASAFGQSRQVRHRFRAILHSGLRELEHPQHSCFGCSVLSGNRDLCSNKRTDKTACDECVRLRRPCCRLWIDPRDRSYKSFAYGFLPLPTELREVDDHRELGYYVRSTVKG